MENATFEQAKEVVQALLPEDKQRLCQWLLEEEHQQQEKLENGRPATALSFEREMRWLSQYRREYIGQWVALDGDKLVSHDEDLSNVFEQARAQGVNAPFTAFIEDPDQPSIGGW